MAAEDELVARAKARIGEVLRGKYRLDSLLGMGGMGAVYRATNTTVGRDVAIKILHRELSARADLRTRFLREALAANAVRHPGVVSVLDHDVAEDGFAFLVMELLIGETLEERWERAGRRLPVAEVVALMLELLDVLVAAHAGGVTIRDLKIENLFIAADGRLRVLDFGVARLQASPGNTLTGVGEIFGTPAYMAPEQALGQGRQVDAQSDLWSAGAVAFTLLSGACVHEFPTVEQTLIAAATRPAPPLASVAPHVAVAIAAVFDRALAFRKRDRWASAAAMRDALAEAQDATIGSALEDVTEWEGGRTRLSAPPAVLALPAERRDGPEQVSLRLLAGAPAQSSGAGKGAQGLLGRLRALAQLSIRFERVASRGTAKIGAVASGGSTLRHRRRLAGASIAGLLAALVIGAVAIALTGIGSKPTASAGTNGGAAAAGTEETLGASPKRMAEPSSVTPTAGIEASSSNAPLSSSVVVATSPIGSATAAVTPTGSPRASGSSPSAAQWRPVSPHSSTKRDPFAP